MKTKFNTAIGRILDFLVNNNGAIILLAYVGAILAFIGFGVSSAAKPVTHTIAWITGILFVGIIPWIIEYARKRKEFRNNTAVSEISMLPYHEYLGRFKFMMGFFFFSIAVGVFVPAIASAGRGDKESTVFLVWDERGDTILADTYPWFDWKVCVRKQILEFPASTLVQHNVEEYKHRLALGAQIVLAANAKNARAILRKADKEVTLSLNESLRVFGRDLIQSQTDELKMCSYPKISMTPISSVPGDFSEFDIQSISITGEFEKTIILKPLAKAENEPF